MESDLELIVDMPGTIPACSKTVIYCETLSGINCNRIQMILEAFFFVVVFDGIFLLTHKFPFPTVEFLSLLIVLVGKGIQGIGT